MTTALEDLITQLVVVETAISGVAAAHAAVPEALGSMPAFINFPSAGSAEMTPGVSHELHTVVAELHVARGDQKVAEAAARPFIQLFLNALWADPTIGGKCDSVNEVRYRYGRLDWNEEHHLGIRFEVDLRQRRKL